MDVFLKVLEVIFALFLVYTLAYLIQMIVSLCISVFELSSFKKRKKVSKKILPNKIAEEVPVSVIIPAYNESACINATIDSLLSEDYPNLEIIAVDDGSADGTEELVTEHYSLEKIETPDNLKLKTQPIIQCYQGKFGDKTLTFVRKANGGKADALNCGINLCESKLCVMLDADTKVQNGSIRIMARRFLTNKKTIICAGAVCSESLTTYPKLGFLRQLLVVFQTLEYYRTFYMQRVMFDRFNSNIIVSGAFAMFDTDLVKQVGGYQVNTIGEDMELTMRLHAYCASQGRKYRIAYSPEAKCVTQLPFTYKDYYNQRKRWHIGMIQSQKLHTYMLANKNYGWAGIMAGTFYILYELLAPFLEIVGLATLIASTALNVVNLAFTVKASVLYILTVVVIQLILIRAVRQYEVEDLSNKHIAGLVLIALSEVLFFHPLNVYIKFVATVTSYKNKRSWNHISRINENK